MTGTGTGTGTEKSSTAAWPELLKLVMGTTLLEDMPLKFEVSDVRCHHRLRVALAPFGSASYRSALPHRAPPTKAAALCGTPQVPESRAQLPDSKCPEITVELLDIAQGQGAAGRQEPIFPTGTHSILGRPQYLSPSPVGRTTGIFQLSQLLTRRIPCATRFSRSP